MFAHSILPIDCVYHHTLWTHKGLSKEERERGMGATSHNSYKEEREREKRGMDATSYKKEVTICPPWLAFPCACTQISKIRGVEPRDQSEGLNTHI